MSNRVNNDNIERRLIALVDSKLSGAKLTHYFETERDVRDDYEEVIFNVAWERADQCGTHRACLNSRDDAMLVWGHYCLDSGNAVLDLISRTPQLEAMELRNAQLSVTQVH